MRINRAASREEKESRRDGAAYLCRSTASIEIRGFHAERRAREQALKAANGIQLPGFGRTRVCFAPQSRGPAFRFREERSEARRCRSREMPPRDQLGDDRSNQENFRESLTSPPASYFVQVTSCDRRGRAVPLSGNRYTRAIRRRSPTTVVNNVVNNVAG